MSVRVLLILVCDRCAKVIDDLYALKMPVEKAERQLRKFARPEWKRVNGKDWCRVCAMGEGYKMPGKAASIADRAKT